MKAIACLLCCSLLFFLACNSDSNTASNQHQPKEIENSSPSSTAPSPTASNATAEQKEEVAPTNNSTVKAAPINYTNLASAYCKCAEHTVSVNQKLKKLMEENDTAAFEAMLPTADKAFKNAMECCRNAKFEQSTAKVDRKKLFNPLKKTCPDLPQQLMLKMVTEIE